MFGEYLNNNKKIGDQGGFQTNGRCG